MDWVTKRKKIVDDLDDSIESREIMLNKISHATEDLSDVGAKISEDLTDLYPIRDLLKDEDITLEFNPAVEEATNSLAFASASDSQNYGRLKAHMGSISTDIGDLRTRTTITVHSSTHTFTSGAVYISAYMNPPEKVEQYVSKITTPSPLDRCKELSVSLDDIQPRLATKLNGAWQTVKDPTKDDRFLQAASSTRELISDLLHTLAPDKDVKTVSWFKPETDNGRPTQAQRARYTMLGKNTKLKEEDLEPILNLSDGIRNTYRSLNSIAHSRDYEKEFQSYTEGYIDQCQIYLLKLLETREKHFEA